MTTVSRSTHDLARQPSPEKALPASGASFVKTHFAGDDDLGQGATGNIAWLVEMILAMDAERIGGKRRKVARLMRYRSLRG